MVHDTPATLGLRFLPVVSAATPIGEVSEGVPSSTTTRTRFPYRADKLSSLQPNSAHSLRGVGYPLWYHYAVKLNRKTP